MRRTPTHNRSRLLTAVLASMVAAVSTSAQSLLPKTQYQAMRPFGFFDVTASAGSSGIGIDVSTPVCNFLKVRAGFAIMPHIDLSTHYHVQVGADYLTPEEQASKFQRLAGYLEEFTGYKVDEAVSMERYPTYYNGRLILDVHPFRNKNWYLSAGLYYGNEDIAKAYNSTDEMATLVAMGIYNKLYDQISASEILTNPDYFLDNSVADMLSSIPLLARFGFDVSPDDPTLGSIYLDPDTRGKQLHDAFQRISDNGRMGIRVGNYARDVVDADGNVIHKQGDPYMMEPDATSMVKGWVKANRLKPYVGFGYSGALKKGDDRWRLGFDCGVLFWGGTPRIMTHDGIDMATDLTDIMGSVKTTVDMVKMLKVLPIGDLRLTYRLGKDVKRPQQEPIVVERYIQVPCPETQTATQTGAAAAATAMATARQDTLRRDIFFAFNSAKVSDEEQEKISEIAHFMQQHPQATVSITGYADRQWGDPATNKGLSERRAAAVADQLANDYQISRSRIAVDSKGDTEQPYDENRKNRVTICIAR